jgi:hypothetical protein
MDKFIPLIGTLTRFNHRDTACPLLLYKVLGNSLVAELVKGPAPCPFLFQSQAQRDSGNSARLRAPSFPDSVLAFRVRPLKMFISGGREHNLIWAIGC